jgi:GNAT superfamily N-acetyltransferase
VIADVTLGGRRVVARGGLEVVIDEGSILDAEAGAWFEDVGPAPRGRSPFAVAARREGHVVGAAVGSTDDELWLDRLAVDAAARGQGVGRHVLRAVEALGAARGCGRAFVLCRSVSPQRSWYRANGWDDDLELPAWRHAQAYVRLTRQL